MTKNTFIILIFLLVNSLHSQPKLEIVNADREVGCIAFNSNNEFIYKIKNTGNEPLIITNVYGGDPFYASGIPKEPIMPGKTSKIIMKYDTKRVGRIYKTGTIYSNSITRVQTIKLKGEVLPFPAIEIEANSAYFRKDDYIQAGDTLLWNINLVNNFPDKIKIEKLEGLDENFQSSFSPTIVYPGESTEIKIKIITNTLREQITKQIFIKHSGDTTKIPISANFKITTSPFIFKENSKSVKVDDKDTSGWYVTFEYKNTYINNYEIKTIRECKYQDDLRRTYIEDYKKQNGRCSLNHL